MIALKTETAIRILGLYKKTISKTLNYPLVTIQLMSCFVLINNFS